MQKLTDYEAAQVFRLLSTTNEVLKDETARSLADAMGLSIGDVHDRFERIRSQPPIRAMAPL